MQLYHLLTLTTDQATLHRFILNIEGRYNSHDRVPYHNNLHGTDVMHSSHVLLDSPTLLDCFSDLEVRANDSKEFICELYMYLKKYIIVNLINIFAVSFVAHSL